MQWYGNVPAVWNANENCLPGAIVPEFHPGPSEVDVCEVESVFIQVTVVPTVILRSPGTNARFPRNSAPAGTTTGVDGPLGAGEVGDEESEPQAIANTKIVDRTARRNDDIKPPGTKSIDAATVVRSEDRSLRAYKRS